MCRNAKVDDWAPQLSRAWRVVQATLEKAAVERAAFASTMQLSIVSAVRAFASQQELQVQRLIAGASFSLHLALGSGLSFVQ